jgi:hypothetical protein
MQAFSTERELTECFIELRKYPNVVGIDGDLQVRIKNRKPVKGTEVIRVYVSEKFPEECFESTMGLIYKVRSKLSGSYNHNHSHWNVNDLIPREINGFEVDVVRMGDVHALCEAAKMKDPNMDGSRPVKPRQSTQTRFRPLESGTSSTHFESTACTLNGLWKEKNTGKILIASNNHCFGRENTAKVGDPILQPSPYDGGSLPEDQVGEFYKFIEIKFVNFKCPVRDSLHKIFRVFKSQGAFFNRVDIAFATLKCPTTCGNKPCDPISNKCAIKVHGIGIPVGKRLPDLNQRVQKVGRTTGKTIGTIVSTSWTGTVKYSRGTATFIDCILVSGTNFSMGGDSGSPVLDMDGNYIGALFAGSGDHSIICKFTNIEIESGCELVVLPPELRELELKKKIKRRTN